MILALNKIIPPKEWLHDKYLRNNINRTVYDYLIESDIDIPEEWNIYRKIDISKEINKWLD